MNKKSQRQFLVKLKGRLQLIDAPLIQNAEMPDPDSEEFIKNSIAGANLWLRPGLLPAYNSADFPEMSDLDKARAGKLLGDYEFACGAYPNENIQNGKNALLEVVEIFKNALETMD